MDGWVIRWTEGWMRETGYLGSAPGGGVGVPVFAGMSGLHESPCLCARPSPSSPSMRILVGLWVPQSDCVSASDGTLVSVSGMHVDICLSMCGSWWVPACLPVSVSWPIPGVSA